MARVAILIDGDNISAVHAARIAALGKSAGRVDAYRAYADATNGSGWNAVPGVRLVHAGTGKNAADLLLSIDAMELGLVEAFETFVLATSDGDFTHLAIRLRERGHCVIGAGEQKAPKSFRAACTEFSDLSAPAPAAENNVSELDRRVRTVIAEHSEGGAGMRIASLGAFMSTRFDTRSDSLRESNWRAYFAARPVLYDLDPRGPDAHVRFKPAGFQG